MKWKTFVLVCLLFPMLAAGEERILATKLRGTNCGRRRIIEGDIRTLTPWNAVIFFKANEKSEPKYFTTGAIIGPTTILTVAPGPLGGPLRGSYEEDKLYPARNFIVGVGLNSTSYSAGDKFTQFAEVYYLEPYLHHGPRNEHYHLLLYHLKTILELKTPYARAVCLVPRSSYEFLLPLLDRAAYPSGYINGFTTTLSSSGSFKYNLGQDISVIETPGYCSRIVGFHYKRKSLEELQLFCAKKLKSLENNNSSLSSNDFRTNITPEMSKPFFPLRNAGANVSETCYVHGSIAVFSFNERFCINGLTALIPGRRRDKCNDATVYIMAEIGQYYDWLSKAVDCSPNKYFCGDTDAICIPVSKVCNGIKDCPNGQDENEALCHAQNTCEAGNSRRNQSGSRIAKQHFCGITDICIPLRNVCDATADCEEGGDELQERCGKIDRTEDLLEGAEAEAKNCTLPPAPLGSFTRCFDPSNKRVPCGNATLPMSYSMEFSCKWFYLPYYDYASVRQKCMDNGKFGGRKPFSCSRECGTYESGEMEKEDGGFASLQKLDRNMPWNTLIFSANDFFLSRADAVCSAVLIDPSFLLTSATCFAKVQSVEVKEVSIILGPVSATYSEGLTYPKASYKMHWVSNSGNSLTDLAVVNTSPADETSKGVVPCFLNNPKYFARAPSVNTIGWMTRFTSELELTATENVEYFNDNHLADSHLYGYQGRVRPGSECGEINSGIKMPNYAFCVAIVMDEKTIDKAGTSLGIGFYTRTTTKNSTRAQYSLKGISITQAIISFRQSAGDSKATFYQWFTGVEPFSDWIVDVLESNY